MREDKGALGSEKYKCFGTKFKSYNVSYFGIEEVEEENIFFLNFHYYINDFQQTPLIFFKGDLHSKPSLIRSGSTIALAYKPFLKYILGASQLSKP